MYLAVSTKDISYVIFYLFSGGKCRKIEAEEIVETRPEGILRALLKFMAEHNVKADNIEGVVIVRGPGSVTALRSGISIVNTLAFVTNAPLYPIECGDGVELADVILNANLSDAKMYTTPFYDKAPNITMPQK